MKLKTFIRENTDRILDKWKAFAASTPGTDSMTDAELQDHARELLDTVLRQIECADGKKTRQSASHDEWKKARNNDTAGGKHATERLEQGFSLFQIMAEFKSLRSTILRLWSQDIKHPTHDMLEEVARFNDGIDGVQMDSISVYSEELDKSRQLFLGVLGHDLRNPLNAMMMNAFAIRLKVANTTREYQRACAIEASGNRMDRLLSDLLDLARTRLGGTLPLNPRLVDISRLIKELVSEQIAIHPSAQILYEAQGAIEGHWDEGRISQLLENIISNAVKHGDNSKPITITATTKGDHARIAVENEGEAIPETKQKSIFDPLTAATQRSKDSTSQAGIGLGLYICRLIAEAHGGDISVVSKPGRTTTCFIVSLPRRLPQTRTED
jgi:signal transduction histidine kinase